MGSIQRAKLPSYNLNDKDQIIDAAGNIYEYNLERKEWIYLGVTPDPNNVSIDNDGLVTPAIYRKLSLLQELIDSGVDFSKFKLGSDSYYYYFNSSDDLIRFSIEKITNPKEVKAVGTVVDFGPVDDQTLVKIASYNFTDDAFAGLFLETKYSSYKIASNSASIVNINGQVNVQIGDSVKIIKPESTINQLRLEIDRGRLYQKLVRNCCVGPKGKKGDKGNKGLTGQAAANEIYDNLNADTNGQYSLETTVNAPIDTPISLRIFRPDSDDHIIEILHPITDEDDLTITIIDNTITIEESSIETSYDITSSLFKASFTINPPIDDLRFKARQKGPKGNKGDDGKPFLEIKNELLDDPSVQSKEAIFTIRKAATSNDIIPLRGSLFESIVTTNLAAIDGDSINDLKDKFMSAKVTIKEAKDVGYFQFEEPILTIPSLDLPSWVPTRDCLQARRWSQYKFNWFDEVEPKYLFHIMPTPKPQEQCGCQEDFFFCPNIGDTPCKIEGEIKAPIPLPVPCDCECYNPLSGSFFGDGLRLNEIDLTSEEFAVEQSESDEVELLTGESQGPPEGADAPIPDDIVVEDPNALIPDSSVKASGINIIESVVDGNTQTFLQEITGLGNIEVRATIDYDPDICGGNSIERDSKQFIDSDAVSSIFTLTDSNNVSEISNDGVWETNTIPVSVAFTIKTREQSIPDEIPEVEPGKVAVPYEEGQELPEGVTNPSDHSSKFDTANLMLTSKINTTGVNYCRGYRLTITSKSDRIEDVLKRTITIIDLDDTTVLPPPEGDTSILRPPPPDDTDGVQPPPPPPPPDDTDGVQPPPDDGDPPPDDGDGVQPPPIDCIGDIDSVSGIATPNIISSPSQWTININCDFDFPLQGIITIEFDPAIDIASMTSSSITSGTIDGTLTTEVGGNTATITRSGGTNSPSVITLIADDITNPSTSGSYEISVVITDPNIGDNCNGAVSGSVNIIEFVTNDDITIAMISPDTFTDSDTNVEYVLVCQTTDTIPENGCIEILFPVGFDISGVTSVTSETLDGTLSITIDGQTLIIERSGGTAAAAGTYDLTINPVTNGGPGYHTVYITTTTSTGDIIDGPNDNTDILIHPPGGVFELTFGVNTNYTEDATSATYELLFETSGSIPGDAQIEVILDGGGAGSNYSGLLSGLSVSSTTLSGSFGFASITNGTISAQRSGSSDAAGAYDVVLTPFTNPVAGVYLVELNIWNSTFTILLESFNNYIYIGPEVGKLERFWVQPVSERWVVFGSPYTFGLDPNTPIPVDGKILIDLPSDQDISTLASDPPGNTTLVSLNGTETITVVGQQLRIARNGDGSIKSDRFYIEVSGIDPPTSGGWRIYKATITDASDVVLNISYAVINFADTISIFAYSGSQLDGSPPLLTATYRDTLFNIVSADGGCGDSHLEPANWLNIASFDNIPVNVYNDPFPLACSYGTTTSVGSSILVGNIHSRNMARFLTQPFPWVPGNIRNVRVIPSNNTGGASSDSYTFHFTTENHLWSYRIAIIWPSVIPSLGTWEVTSNTIGNEFDSFSIVLIGGTTLRLTSTGNLTLPPGNYDVTITYFSGATIPNPPAGLQQFGIETRVAATGSPENDDPIDTVGYGPAVFI